MRHLALCEPDAARGEALAKELGAPVHARLDQALAAERPDAVLVCTPPHLHTAQALAAVEHGAHVFIEKPVSDRMEGLDILEAAAAKAGRIIQVGYQLRFHPALEAMAGLLATGGLGRVLWVRAEYAQYLPDWRPARDYRASYTARKAQGGGILLDASHEFDYLRALFGEVAEVACFAGNVSDLQMDAEDTAAVLLRFASGVLGEVHLDCVARTRARGCTIAGTAGTAVWDAVAGTLRVHVAATKAWQEHIVPPTSEAAYAAEVLAFLRAAARAEAPRVSLDDGRRALQLALAAREASAQGRTIRLLDR